MSNIDKQALRQTAEKAQEHGAFNMDIHSQTVLALLDELEAKAKAWSVQDDHINQQADRIESLEKKNGELGQAYYERLREVAELRSRAEAAEKRIADHDRKCDEQYLLGMCAGWNFGTLEDADGFNAAYASRSKLTEADRAGTAKGE